MKVVMPEGVIAFAWSSSSGLACISCYISSAQRLVLCTMGSVWKKQFCKGHNFICWFATGVAPVRAVAGVCRNLRVFVL
jgi:hypothetical protein